MGLTNFRAEDFDGSNSGPKISRSKRDRLSGPKPSTTPRVSPDVDPEDVPSGTVPEIMTWVGDDPVRAQKALDVELQDDRPRKGLVSSLSEMVNDAANDGTAEPVNDGTVVSENDGTADADADATTAGDPDTSADTGAENVPDAPTNEPTSN